MLINNNFMNIYYLNKKKIANIIVSHSSLLIIASSLLISFLLLMLMKPYFWLPYNSIIFSPFIDPIKPNDSTIYAIPCIIEIYMNYTCNNNYYENLIDDLTCPSNYVCSYIEENLYCVSNYCKIIESPKIINNCIDQTYNLLGSNLYLQEQLPTNNYYDYVFVIILMILLLIIFISILVFVSNYIIFNKYYNGFIFNILVFIIITIIYFSSLPLMCYSYWLMLPDIYDYTTCFYMDTFTFSSSFPSVLVISFISFMLILSLIYISIIYTFMMNYYKFHKKIQFFEKSLDLELWL